MSARNELFVWNGLVKIAWYLLDSRMRIDGQWMELGGGMTIIANTFILSNLVRGHQFRSAICISDPFHRWVVIHNVTRLMNNVIDQGLWF